MSGSHDPKHSGDPKQGEREYYRRIGAEGLAHAAAKPLNDPRAGHYLADLGALLMLLRPPPASLLDLGCGTGWTTRYLAQAGYTVTGVDIAPEAIAKAIECTGPAEAGRATFRVGDYEHPPSIGVFDYVLFYDALHHAEDEAAALACAFAALKPDGVLVAFEPGEGHHRSESSVRAVKEFGVHEKEMPPHHIIAVGKRVGFRSGIALPTPHDFVKTLYRRDLSRPASTLRLWMERTWAYFRVMTRMRTLRRGGMTILFKGAARPLR